MPIDQDVLMSALPVEDDGPDVLGIGELCQKYSLTPRTLRYYEQRGLLAPARGQSHDIRLYDRAQRERLRLILKGKEYGFTLREISELLPSASRPERKTAEALILNKETARTQLKFLTRQRAGIDKAIRELHKMLEE